MFSKKQRLGWVKDRFDGRDYLHKPKVAKIQEIVILSEWLPSVRNQGGEGSCVGHAIGATLTAMAKKTEVFTEWFSPRWIYNGARFLEGWLVYDDGCYPRDALEWLLEKGCLLEKFWPYVAQQDTFTTPSSKLDAEAAKYPLLEYIRVDNGVNGICSALQDGYYVSIGTPWFDKWMNPKKGVLPTVKVKDSVAGGHASCLYGFNYPMAIFYGINSWGEDFGDKGFFTMPFQAFDVFKKLGGYDSHYVKVEWTVAPTPPIPTTKKVQLFINDKEEFVMEV